MAGDVARQGCRPSLVNKKFLLSNSTSHEWMFGAIAEILDNATDPDVLATQFWIDVETIGNEKCLVLTDNGKGMSNDTLYRMLSFGFSEKTEVNGHKPIGRYGNGFKSGSMRLAKDALVFTKQAKATMSVGMLSQTYLDKIKSDTVVVPIVTWDCSDGTIEYPDTNEKSSLAEIIKYSICKSEDQLIDQIYKIIPKKSIHQGTRIVLYNLAKDKSGNLELDFDSDPYDILIPSSQQELEQCNEKDKSKSVSKYRNSLRKYISILYLRPRMQVMLRSKKVTSICMLKCLSNKKRFTYTPKKISKDPINIDFGINQEKDEYGVVIYHRNRLIQPFRKNSFIKKSLPEKIEYNQIREIVEQAVGVVELDCVTPNHIKQNFQDDTTFRNIDQNIVSRLWDYCMEVLESKEARDKALDLWVQCCHPDCQKWRLLPHGIKKENIPETWFCMMNPDVKHNFCEAEEESEEETEIQKPKKKILLPTNTNEVSAPMASSSNSNEASELVATSSKSEECGRRPIELPAEMMGVVNKIISTERVVLKPKRRRISSRRSSNQPIYEVARPQIMFQKKDASTSTEPFQSELELQREDEIRKLRMELDSKQAVIADLEQRNESLRSEDVVVIGGTIKEEERERHARLLNLVGRYLTRIWPDFDKNERNIEVIMEQLVEQAERLQEQEQDVQIVREVENEANEIFDLNNC
uniref:CW-type domain-containing protein n=1 Tax=Strigamia maritima TaxID=126957 RepID=T1JJV4_STRMM